MILNTFFPPLLISFFVWFYLNFAEPRIDFLKKIGLTGQRALVIVSIFICSLLLMNWSWLKWADPVIDFGREVYNPWQVSLGKHLYTDISQIQGPLSVWINATVFKFFTPNLLTLVVTNYFFSLIIAVSIYLIIEKMYSAFFGVLASFVFLTIFAYSQYLGVANYNYIHPYSHELTHGTVLCLLGMLTWVHLLKAPSVPKQIALSILIGLCFLTKPEMFFALFSISLIGYCALFYLKKPIARVAAIFPAIGVITIAYIFLYSTTGPQKSLYGLLGGWAHIVEPSVIDNPFQRRVMGVEDIKNNLKGLLLAPLVLLGILQLISLSVRHTYSKVIVFFFVTVTSILLYNFVSPYDLLYCLPALLAFSGIRSLIAMIKHRVKSNQAVLEFMFSMLSVLFLSRMFFRPTFTHYGFVMALPGTIFMVGQLPRMVSSHFSYLKEKPLLLNSLFLSFVLTSSFSALNASNDIYQAKRIVLGQPGNQIALFQDDAVKISNIAHQLKERMKDGDTFMMIPEGPLLNFLMKRENPTGVDSLLPLAIPIYGGEEHLLEKFQKRPPTFIVYMPRYGDEWGFPFFGKDFALSIDKWIRSNYEIVWKMGEDPYVKQGQYGILLWKFKSKENQK